jgi:hypothetical protein
MSAPYPPPLTPPPTPHEPPNNQPQPNDIEALELEGVRAILRTERLRLATNAAACQYRCFFSWLLRVLRMLDTQGRCGRPLFFYNPSSKLIHLGFVSSSQQHKHIHQHTSAYHKTQASQTHAIAPP